MKLTKLLPFTAVAMLALALSAYAVDTVRNLPAASASLPGHRRNYGERLVKNIFMSSPSPSRAFSSSTEV